MLRLLLYKVSDSGFSKFSLSPNLICCPTRNIYSCTVSSSTLFLCPVRNKFIAKIRVRMFHNLNHVFQSIHTYKVYDIFFYYPFLFIFNYFPNILLIYHLPSSFTSSIQHFLLITLNLKIKISPIYLR